MLSVDPGLSGTGWVLWDSSDRPVKAGILTPRAAEPLFDRCRYIAQNLYKIQFKNQDFLLVCEYPRVFDSAIGQAVARRGDLVKLAVLVGVIAGRCRSSSFVPMPVNEWKGTLPKPVVERRVQAILGVNRCRKLGAKSHIYDALGIGLHFQGRFN
jgi:hypothetical protein